MTDSLEKLILSCEALARAGRIDEALGKARTWLLHHLGDATAVALIDELERRATARRAPMMQSSSSWVPGRRVFDDFTVECLVGRGGMGAVYLVSDGAHRFAAKQVLRELVCDERSHNEFLREVQAWIALPRNLHLVACHFVRGHGEHTTIFCEYVDGGTLHDWIAAHRLVDLEVVLDLAIQIAWGLHAAHRWGVVHQDVKPGNVLVTSSGVAKVADFGLARVRSTSAVGHDAGRVVEDRRVSVGGMTPAYCSPEQAGRRPVDHRTDVWSWGASVLEMFAGGVFWNHGPRAREALETYLAGGWLAMGGLPIPEPVGHVLRRALDADPANRWPSLLEAAETLRTAHWSLLGRAHARAVPSFIAPGEGIGSSSLEEDTDPGLEDEEEEVWYLEDGRIQWQRGVGHLPYAVADGASARLVVVEIGSVDLIGGSFVLDEARGSAAIGTSASADLRLHSPRVSPLHAFLHADGNRWVIEDNRSRNHVYVGDTRVERHALADGDEIHLGDVVLRYLARGSTFRPENHNPVCGLLTPSGLVRELQQHDRIRQHPLAIVAVRIERMLDIVSSGQRDVIVDMWRRVAEAARGERISKWGRTGLPDVIAARLGYSEDGLRATIQSLASRLEDSGFGLAPTNTTTAIAKRGPNEEPSRALLAAALVAVKNRAIHERGSIVAVPSGDASILEDGLLLSAMARSRPAAVLLIGIDEEDHVRRVCGNEQLAVLRQEMRAELRIVVDVIEDPRAATVVAGVLDDRIAVIAGVDEATVQQLGDRLTARIASMPREATPKHPHSLHAVAMSGVSLDYSDMPQMWEQMVMAYERS